MTRLFLALLLFSSSVPSTRAELDAIRPLRTRVDSYYASIQNIDGTYSAYVGSTGATLSSSTSFDTVFAAVLTAMGSTAGVIEFGPGTFTSVTGMVIARGNIVLRGQGKGVTTIQLSASATDTTELLSVKATNVATAYALTANAAQGDLTLTMSSGDAANLAAGNYILLRSGLDIDTELSGRKQGDLYIVQSVAGGTVTLGSAGSGMAVREAMTTANGAAVDKLTMYENVTIKGISFKDLATSRADTLTTGQTDFRYVFNLDISDCSFTDMYYAGIQLYQNWNSHVHDCDFRKIKDVTPSQNTYYGVEVHGACLNTVVSGCTFHDMRHAITQAAGSATVLAGRTRTLVMDGNVSSTITTAHFDTHQGAEGIVISNNTLSNSDSASNGIQVRSPSVVIGNTVSNILGTAISVFGAATGSVIKGNNIRSCTTGIVIDVGVTDVNVSGNLITGTTTGYPILLNSSGGIHGGDDSIISGNYIYGNVTGTYGIAVDSASNVLIVGNKIKASTAVRILTTDATGTNVVVTGNFLSGLGGTPFQNFSASSTHILLNNYGYNLKGNSGATVSTPFPTGAGNVTNYASTNAVPDSATNYTIAHSPKNITVTGGTVTDISINGVTAAIAGGSFRLGIGDVIKVTYSVAPTVVVKIV